MLDFLYDVRTNKQKLIAVTVVFAVVAYIDFSFILKAQVKSLAAVKSKASKLRADIQTVKKDIALMRQNKDKGKAAFPVKRIVSEGELLSLLGRISEIAKENLVKVSQISPQKTNRAPVKSGQKQSPFIQVLIRLDISCGYHNLGAFINDLENSEYAISAENIKITPISPIGQVENVLLTLKTYVKP